jgi:uncharacterized cysteine cluster protein YcgN (CxxCxxCC family)
MTQDPIKRDGLQPRFWEKKPLSKMSNAEWEALCDGCGKCCMNKIEDEDTGRVYLTRVSADCSMIRPVDVPNMTSAISSFPNALSCVLTT